MTVTPGKYSHRRFYPIYFMVFFAQGFSYCLLVTYLISLGYSPTERGVMFMAEAIFSMIMSVISGYLCDRYHRIKPFLYLSLIGYAAATHYLYTSPQQDFWKHFILVMLVGGLLMVSNGLMDSLTLQTGEQCRENFGIIRSFGSIGWAVCAPISAIMVENYGYGSLSMGFLISTAILILLCLGIADINVEGNRKKITFGEIQTLFSNRNYRVIVMILFLFFLVDISQNYGVLGKMSALNCTERDVGYYWAMVAFLELPLFFHGNRLARKLGSYSVLIFAGVMYTVRYIIYGSVTTVGGIFLAGALQSVTYPLLTVLSKSMVHEQSPNHLKTSGQQVAGAVYASGSSLIAPMLIGVLEDASGINMTLYAVAFVAFVATLLAIKEKRRKNS